MNEHTPTNVEAERIVIGALLRDPSLVPVAFSMLNSRAFWDITCLLAARAIEVLEAGQKTIRPNTVLAQMRDMDDDNLQGYGVDMAQSVMAMYSDMFIPPTEELVREYASEVLRCATLRNAYDLISQERRHVIQHPGEPREVIDPIISKLMSLTSGSTRSLSGDARSILNGSDTEPALTSELLEELASPDIIKGLETGWHEFDRALGGLMPAKVYTLIADTGVGKSLWAHWLAWRLMHRGYKVLIVSTEMSRKEVLRRIAYMEAQIDIETIKRRVPAMATDSEFKRLNEAIEWLDSGNQLVVTDIGSPDIHTVLGEVRRHKAMRDIDIVFLDHIQHIQVKGIPVNEERQTLTAVTRETKGAAMNLYLPFVQISHIPRDAARAGFAGLHGGKGSGSIEQDSDVHMELCCVQWGIDPNTGMKGWVPFATEQDLKQYQNTHEKQPIRWEVHKNRNGKRPWDVRIRDWAQGGRLLRPEQEDMS